MKLSEDALIDEARSIYPKVLSLIIQNELAEGSAVYMILYETNEAS